jgi:hypothetical protein
MGVVPEPGFDVPYFAGSIPYIDPQSHHPSELMMELFLTNPNVDT